jgi:hypothetical protein
VGKAAVSTCASDPAPALRTVELPSLSSASAALRGSAAAASRARVEGRANKKRRSCGTEAVERDVSDCGDRTEVPTDELSAGDIVGAEIGSGGSKLTVAEE